jgi:hypothetical protein
MPWAFERKYNELKSHNEYHKLTIRCRFKNLLYSLRCVGRTLRFNAIELRATIKDCPDNRDNPLWLPE